MVLDLHSAGATGRLARANPVAKLVASFGLGFGVALSDDPATPAVVLGVNSEGFRIMVQPAASAGATLQAIWFSGQFQGVIMPTTPTGSRTTTAEGSVSSK